MLKDQRIMGTLTGISGPENEAYLLTVQVSDTETVEIVMPAEVEPYIKLYMEKTVPVSIETIEGLLGCDKTLEVNIAVVSKDADVLEATDVRVYAENVKSEVVFLF